jgi:hypothetical protein
LNFLSINSMPNKYLTKTLLISLFLFALCATPFAQNQKIDLNALVEETQKDSDHPDEMTLVWWVPEAFWKTSFEQDKDVTPKQAEDFMKILRPYIVVIVVDGKIGTFGSMTYKTEALIKNNIQIVDGKGNSFRPLPEDKISSEAKTMLSIMKPVMVNMLGAIGQNMHFILFPAQNAKSEEIINVMKEGSLAVKLDAREFKWRLPLSSLVPRKVCPVDGETHNGAWKYCPWHGTELKNQ